MNHEILTGQEMHNLLEAMDKHGGAIDLDSAGEDFPGNEDDLNFVPINPLSSFLSAKTNKSARIYILTSDFVNQHNNSEDIGGLEEILTQLFVGKNKEVADTLKELIMEADSDAYIKALAATFLLISKILLETATKQLQECENTIKELRQQREDVCLLFIF